MIRPWRIVLLTLAVSSLSSPAGAVDTPVIRVAPPSADTRAAADGGELSREQIELFLKVYPSLIDQIVEKNKQSKGVLPHPSETKKILAKWPAVGRYLQRYGLTPGSWRELADRVIRVWSWYWQNADLKLRLEALEQNLRDRTDTSPAAETRRREKRERGDPDGMIRMQLTSLGAQLRALQVQPGRPAQVDLDLLAGFEAPLMEALLEAERHVSDANRHDKK